jgi:hypothetical protein
MHHHSFGVWRHLNLRLNKSWSLLAAARMLPVKDSSGIEGMATGMVVGNLVLVASTLLFKHLSSEGLRLVSIIIGLRRMLSQSRCASLISMLFYELVVVVHAILD